MKTLLSMILLLNACLLFGAPKDDKKKVEPTDASGNVVTEGVVYNLPLTGIRIQVQASREVHVAGPFAQFASKYLGIENVPISNTENWTIEGITLETFSEPDPKQTYKAMGTTAALLNLTESGILSGINSTAVEPEKMLAAGNFVNEKLMDDFPFTDVSMWGMYTKSDSLHKYKFVPKTLEEKAAEAAETIFNLRNSRFRLLTNADDEPLPDGKAFEVMGSKLGEMESNYIALFTGKSTKKTYRYSFDFIPDENSVKGQVVFRFAENKGVLPKSDLSGKPIIIDVTKVEDLSAGQKKLSGSDNPTAGASGVYYRMPGKAEVSISNGVSVMATDRLTIAQFGTTAAFPEALLDGNHKVSFHPTSGAIKSIVPVSETK